MVWFCCSSPEGGSAISRIPLDCFFACFGNKLSLPAVSSATLDRVENMFSLFLYNNFVIKMVHLVNLSLALITPGQAVVCNNFTSLAAACSTFCTPPLTCLTAVIGTCIYSCYMCLLCIIPSVFKHVNCKWTQDSLLERKTPEVCSVWQQSLGSLQVWRLFCFLFLAYKCCTWSFAALHMKRFWR